MNVWIKLIIEKKSKTDNPQRKGLQIFCIQIIHPKRNPAACSSFPSNSLRACITASLWNPNSTSFATLASNSGPCNHNIKHSESVQSM